MGKTTQEEIKPKKEVYKATTKQFVTVSRRFSSKKKSISNSGRIIYGSTNYYTVNPQYLYIKKSRRSWVSLLKDSEGKEYIGKFVSSVKHQQLIAEIFFMNFLKGQTICNMIEIVKDIDGHWIVMEKGYQTLQSFLQKIYQTNAKKIMKNIALSYLIFFKNNIAHRDIKPSNLIVNPDLTIKFIDLELCQKNDHIYGTEFYLPPEIKQINWSRCDAWAYGLIGKKICERLNQINSKQCDMQPSTHSVTTLNHKETKIQEIQTQSQSSPEVIPEKNMQTLVDKCLQKDSTKRWGWEQIFDFWGIKID